MNNHSSAVLIICLHALLLSACGSDNPSETTNLPIAKQALIKAGDNQRFLDYYQQALENTNQQIRNLPTTSESANAGGSGSTNTNFGQSSTNIIEAGVDEADVIKQNANYVYTWDIPTTDLEKEKKTLTLKVFSKPTAQKIAAVSIEGVYPEGVFLTEQYLAALSTKSYPQWSGYNGDVPIAPQSLSFWRWGAVQNGKAQLDVMSVTNNVAEPKLNKHYEWDGDIVASRRIANMLYVVTQSSIAMPPTTQTTLTQTDIIDRMPINAQGLRVNPQDCYIAQTTDKQNINSSIVLITAIDLTATQTPQTTCVAASTQQVYVSQKSLYLVAGQGWNTQKTVFHKFSFANSALQYRATGEVLGGILWSNPAFSMSEHKDYFRIVTSEFVTDTTTGLNDINNRLYILKESTTEQGVFEQVAQLPNKTQPARIGKPREQIMGMRFFGDNAYIVTFERKDPLYKVDLTEPTQPRLAGQLELTGYSAYLQQLTPRYLLGVGFAVDERTTRENGIQVSIFDTNLDNPTLVSQDIYYPNNTDTNWFDLPLARDWHAITTLSNSMTTRMILPFSQNNFTNNITKALQYEIDERTGVLKRITEQNINLKNAWWGSQRAMLDGDSVYWNQPQGEVIVSKWGQQVLSP